MEVKCYRTLIGGGKAQRQTHQKLGIPGTKTRAGHVVSEVQKLDLPNRWHTTHQKKTKHPQYIPLSNTLCPKILHVESVIIIDGQLAR